MEARKSCADLYMRLWCGVLSFLIFAIDGASAGLALKPCHPEGVKQELRCGMLMVPENRSKSEGRKLALEVVVVPARKQPAKEPIFFLSGGPVRRPPIKHLTSRSSRSPKTMIWC
jgi:hypothetical protein